VKRLAAAVVLACVALLLASCTSSHKPSSKPKPSELVGAAGTPGGYQGVGIDPPQARPSFQLTDTSGKPFSFAQETAGHPTLLYFGYTNCPDVCPTTMFDIGSALRSLPASLQQKTYVVFVTTDVKHDTGPVIGKWLSNFDSGTSAKFVGLYGTQAQIDAAQAAAHVQLATDDGQTHAAQVFLFGTDNYARVAYLQSTNEKQQIAHDLPMVA
jgi:protein SCO1/2